MLLYGHELMIGSSDSCSSTTRVQTNKQTVTGEAARKLVLSSRWLQPEDLVVAVCLSEDGGVIDAAVMQS